MTDNSLVAALKKFETEGLAAVRDASDLGALEQVRVDLLGRKEGSISLVLRGLSDVPPDERPTVGQEANRVKEVLKKAIGERESSFLEGVSVEYDDLTLPSRANWEGAIHPITQAVDEISKIFRELGFTRARGPEADTEWYNFEALNTPLDHPAADEQDTLYLKDSVLLRSHTSPVQMRTMEKYDPPIRIIAPGWVYRRDTYDATHTPAFMQVEGLVIDEGITFVDFKATLAEFARRYWGPDTEVRFRPSFFPFTEPSAEVDVKRVITRQDGTQEEMDWLEIMGAGMVDPAVIENAGYDPERYTGFAFGMGPGRIAMIKHGVNDLRRFFENDVRFLGQFTS
ncbi:MAG: phenylalanine--tRNA ligase alpha subunit [Gammaproteobacteria bacterium]|jgi:phenylalanyl-tRNA synthetase alpha chain|nr:phenylalanine--tRNA ligase subunit alpha [Gemmatimonadota bacterium]GIS80154.1 MAG: phenylalanine--tRNA ligase alpha subunit [Gammaproteobacteria bacterium]HCK91081.1 phenylalanine--tRNA ligase subunit alpha [Gemmatimonadota bacterium]|tara:strand:+ start:2328 stop:3350 length:1023 start_codon:yes stop_codon:yes gene_type:complete